MLLPDNISAGAHESKFAFETQKIHNNITGARKLTSKLQHIHRQPLLLTL